jgi:hypothetical protein
MQNCDSFQSFDTLCGQFKEIFSALIRGGANFSGVKIVGP